MTDELTTKESTSKESITKEQLQSEFGLPGVDNPNVIDLVTTERNRGLVVLSMFERRPWQNGAQQLREIEEKINRYLGYVLDGFLVRDYPDYAGKLVQIRLECAEAPQGEATRFIAAARHAIERQGLEFVVVERSGA